VVKNRSCVNRPIEQVPEPDNDDDAGLTDHQQDQILGLQQKFKWGLAQVALIAKAVKASEDDVRRFLTPTAPKPDLHLIKPAADVGSLIGKVRSILQTADYDQVSLTQRYMDVGRLLHDIKKAICKHGEFEKLLAESFPDRSLSTLHEYMALAKGFEAADDTTKVQLIGLFKHGWAGVLEEIRRLKRGSRPRPGPLTNDISAIGYRILVSDCRVRLQELPDESVDCIITSPPYYRQRINDVLNLIWDGDPTCDHVWEMHPDKMRAPNSKVPYSQHLHHEYAEFEWGTCRKCGAWFGQLGLEPTPELYIRHLVQIFRELRRVLKKTGTLWINIGDSYENGRLRWIPHRLALALDDDGWIGRNEIIWQKGEGACESVTNRFTRNHEQVLFFAKSEKYEFDIEAIKEPAKYAHDRRNGQRVLYNGKCQGAAGTGQRGFVSISDTRIKRTVWNIPRQPTKFDHYGVMPEDLIEPPMLAGCPEGGVCLDPFGGVGSTALVALKHKRRAILIEASPQYEERLAARRIMEPLAEAAE
jgi:DNA modification methylase